MDHQLTLFWRTYTCFCLCFIPVKWISSYLVLLLWVHVLGNRPHGIVTWADGYVYILKNSPIWNSPLTSSWSKRGHFFIFLMYFTECFKFSFMPFWGTGMKNSLVVVCLIALMGTDLNFVHGWTFVMLGLIITDCWSNKLNFSAWYIKSMHRRCENVGSHNGICKLNLFTVILVSSVVTSSELYYFIVAPGGITIYLSLSLNLTSMSVTWKDSKILNSKEVSCLMDAMRQAAFWRNWLVDAVHCDQMWR